MTATFRPGDRVRVRKSDKPGHVRTPEYLKGNTGWVESVLGEFRNPEDLAYGLSGLPESPLYKVGFRLVDLWSDYEGSADDNLFADIYEHWLEREEGKAVRAMLITIRIKKPTQGRSSAPTLTESGL